MLTPAPGIPIPQQATGVVLRCLIYGEARGEPPLGQLAVLAVANNRARIHGTDIKTIVLAHEQFSCFNPDDPNYPLLLIAYAKNPMEWAKVDFLCNLWDAGGCVDPAHGATHYYVTDMPNPPAWSKPENGWTTTAVIGKQTFGRAA